MRLSPTGARTMPVMFPAASTNAPPDDARPEAAAVSRRPAVVGPVASATRPSVDAMRPLFIQGDVSPGLGAPTTQTVSPARGGGREGGPGGTRGCRRHHTQTGGA